jgi:hypothetical protein
VSLGDTLGDDWKVVAIDAQAVTFQHVAAGIYQQLWFGGGKAQLLPAAESQGAQHPRLRWDAPTKVQPGSEFSVVLFVPGLEIQHGAIVLDYDPDVLLMTDATGKWEGYHGRAQLQIAEAGDGDYLAEVAFRVVAGNASVTRLRVNSMTLFDSSGSLVSSPADPDLQIEVAVPAPR